MENMKIESNNMLDRINAGKELTTRFLEKNELPGALKLLEHEDHSVRQGAVEAFKKVIQKMDSIVDLTDYSNEVKELFERHAEGPSPSGTYHMSDTARQISEVIYEIGKRKTQLTEEKKVRIKALRWRKSEKPPKPAEKRRGNLRIAS